MAILDQGAASLRLSSKGLEGADRDAAMRELFGRGYLSVDVEFLGDRPFLQASAWQLPGLVVTTGQIAHSRVSTYDPTSQPNTVIFGGGSGKAVIRCRGQELSSGRGEAIMFRATDKMDSENFMGWAPRMLRIDAPLLEAMLPDLDDRMMQLIPGDHAAMRLLDQYLPLVCTHAVMSSPRLAQAAVHHLIDLVVLALGATGEAAEMATMRGYYAARSAEVRGWILRRLADPQLSLESVAAAHRLAERTIQDLFHREHTSFTAFVRDARLDQVYRRLNDPVYGKQAISAIAFGLGFNDLSYFNRRFRARFGRTPSDVRAAAQHVGESSTWT